MLKIMTLSGTEGVTKNMTVYEYGDDIILLDCGIGFPDAEMLGIDVVIPDFTYILENRHKVRGLFITHGHEDHFGAVSFLLQELNVPIYANPLVQGFVKSRIVDRGSKQLLEDTSLHLIGPDVPEIVLGNFKVTTFRVNHSVPTTLGFCIETPEGKVLHMADYKVDLNPVLDEPIDFATISRHGKEGVLCLLSDALGSTHEGYSRPERQLEKTFNDIFDSADRRQIMVTTISSNISRMYQIMNAANKRGRKIVLGGRSINQSVEIARNLKLLPFSDDLFVDDKNSSDFRQSDLVYIVAGCYGQVGSTLERVSRHDHKTIQLDDNALVVFSADPNPPGVGPLVEKVMDNLTLNGAEVLYSEIQDNLHVSGHGLKGDLSLIAAMVKPKYFIPIGSTITKARAYANMVAELGFDKNSVFELLEGESVVFEHGEGRRGPVYPVKQVLVDGSGVGDVGTVVIKDRERLSNEGVFVVVVPISRMEQNVTGSVDVITKGFVYVKESKQLLGKAKDLANKLLDKEASKSIENWGNIQSKIEKDLGKMLYKETGRNPMIIVHALTV